jgi:DNA polymerase-3 subunit beta
MVSLPVLAPDLVTVLAAVTEAVSAAVSATVAVTMPVSVEVSVTEVVSAANLVLVSLPAPVMAPVTIAVEAAAKINTIVKNTRGKGVHIMQIRVSRLRSYLAILGACVPKKPSLSILSNILISNGRLIATDLQTKISIAIPEARDCNFLLPYKTVLEQLKYTSGDDLLNIDTSIRGKLTLKWDSGISTLAVPSADDFPNAGDTKILAEGSLDGTRFISALDMAIPYCAKESERPVLAGVTVYLGDIISVAAADGFRMSYQSLSGVSFPYPNTSIILPIESINALKNLWTRQPANPVMQNSLIAQLLAKRCIKATLYEDDGLKFSFDNVELSCRLISGHAPDHLALLKNYSANNVKISFIASEAQVALKRIASIAKSNNSITRLQWTGDKTINISASDSEKGTSSVSSIPILSIIRGGDPVNTIDRIAVNHTYLLEYLNGKDGIVHMSVSTRSSPPLFNYGDFLPIVTIMPMAVQWDDEKPAEKTPENKEEKEEDEEPPEDESEENMELSCDDNVEVSSIFPNRIVPLTVKDVRDKIIQAQKQSAAWQAKAGQAEVAKSDADVQAAKAQMQVWDNMVIELNTFLEDNGIEVEEEEEKEVGETVAVE